MSRFLYVYIQVNGVEKDAMRRYDDDVIIYDGIKRTNINDNIRCNKKIIINKSRDEMPPSPSPTLSCIK